MQSCNRITFAQHFLAFGTEEQLKSFVCDNVNLPYLRFYYRHVHVSRRIEKAPLIVPNYPMESLKIICAAEASKTIISFTKVPKFEKGQLIMVIDGAFKGVIGRVARPTESGCYGGEFDNYCDSVYTECFLGKII